jgi:energy-coupling factor transporter ATP-binding protein EcfA2
MSQRFSDILRRLEALAEYAGPWRPLREAIPLLKLRVGELKEREGSLDDMLVVALVGGSGVGKSTMLNAIAGDTLARTSEFRPCTSTPTVYHPPGADIDFDNWNAVAGSALENLVIVDTPDSDTIVHEHRDIVIEALKKCDLILMCGSAEKYLDEATWSLLRPLQGERTMVCIETKASLSESVRDHWMGKLEGEGFAVADYFRLDGRRTLDRKLHGGAPGDDEFDITRFERFLAQELDREQVRRIKRSNATGLLRKTLDTLYEGACARQTHLEELAKALSDADGALLRESFTVVRDRLFAEPHLWNYALGREVSLRAKGFMGAINRIFESLRTLPTRMSNWLPVPGRGGSGHQAAAMLGDRELFTENVDLAAGQIKGLYTSKRSELALAFAQRGFDLPDDDDGFAAFDEAVQGRIAGVLRGPARDRLVSRARVLTSWPLAIAADVPPLLFLGFTVYQIVKAYFSVLQPPAFFFHAGVVFAVLLIAEMIVTSTLARLSAWSARRGAIGDLRAALALPGAAFAPQRAALEEATRVTQQIAELRSALK